MAEEALELLKPARDQLIRQAAQGEVLDNDDTGMKVRRLEREVGDRRTLRVHQRDRFHSRGAQNRTIFHRPPARAKESGRCTEAARQGAEPFDPDERCAVMECAAVTRGHRVVSGPLPGARPGKCERVTPAWPSGKHARN